MAVTSSLSGAYRRASHFADGSSHLYWDVLVDTDPIAPRIMVRSDSFSSSGCLHTRLELT